MVEEFFPPQSILFQHGDPSDCAFLIREGSVEVLAGPGAGPAAVLGPGAVLGEMGLIEERPRPFAARARTAVRADVLRRADFERLLTEDPGRCRAFLTALFERLRGCSARLGGSAALVPAAAGAGVTVFPLTRLAAQTLPGAGLPVATFPFRLGRASEPGEPEALDLNDLWLLDRKPFQVSRNHAQIEVDGDGLAVVDRGSYLGTIVNEERIGGKFAAWRARLEPGDNTLVLGSPVSPYQFRVAVCP